jgi:hypothetical protein
MVQCGATPPHNIGDLEVFMLGHLFHTDSADSVDCPSTGQGLYTDRVLVHVLLNRQSVSKLSLNRIRANHADCTDSRTEHRQTPYGLHTA